MSVQIFGIENDEIVANIEAIDRIFSQKEVSQRPVRIVVISGEPRIGKSTFGNVLCGNSEGIDLGEEAEEGEDEDGIRHQIQKQISVLKKAFVTSNSTIKPLTKGIWITPKPIPVKYCGRLAYNAFIVDVEGIFGPNSKQVYHQHMFVLAALMSTTFVYFTKNVFNGSPEEIIKSYSTLAETIEKNLEKLVIVINDHPNEKEFRYGSKDSEKYIESLNENMKFDLKQFNNHFRKVECFLMPEPLDKIRKREAEDQADEINLDLFGPEYLKYSMIFRKSYVTKVGKSFKLLNTGFGDVNLFNIVPNAISNNHLKKYHKSGSSFKEFIKHVFKLVKSPDMLRIPSLLVVEADRLNENESKRLVYGYNQLIQPVMKSLVEESQTLMSKKPDLSQLQELHITFMNKALEEFDQFPWSNWECSKDYRQEMFNEMDNYYRKFIKNLESLAYVFILYKNSIEKYIWKINFVNNTHLIEDLDEEHMRLIDKYEKLFNLTICSDEVLFNFEFLRKKIIRVFALVKSNIIELEKAIKFYGEWLETEYSGKPWYKRFFLSSNQYINIHNEVILSIIDYYKRNICKEIETDVYMNRLYNDCKNHIQDIYDKINKKENITLGTGMGIGAAIGSTGFAGAFLSTTATLAALSGLAFGGGVVLVGSGLGLLIYKILSKGDINDPVLKKND